MATKKTPSPSAKSPAKAPAKSSASAKSAAAKSPAKPAASSSAEKRTPATREQIAELAHQYFHERGGHHGSHVADWLRAERELNG